MAIPYDQASISFTASGDGPTGTKAGTLVGNKRGNADAKTIVRGVDGFGPFTIFVGASSGRRRTFRVYIEAASYDAVLTEAEAWEALKGGNGTVTYTAGSRTEALTGMTLLEVEIVSEKKLDGSIDLIFLKGQT